MASTRYSSTDEESAALWADRAQSPDFSPAERAALSAWLAASPARAGLFERHQRLVSAPALGQALIRSRARAQARPLSAPLRRLAPWSMAAAALAVVVIGVAVTLPSADLRSPQGRSVAQTLADGSEVTLNGDTQARVRLARDARDIQLERGEAYFEVAHDPERPFTVHAREAAVTAVGTAFNVNRLDGATEITVYEGKVRVTPDFAPDQPRLLSAGQKLRVSAHRIDYQVNFALGATDDWRKGWVEMDNGTLGDLVTELNRASGTPIELADPQLASLRLTGRFRADDPRDTAQLIAATHSLRLTPLEGRLRLER